MNKEDMCYRFFEQFRNTSYGDVLQLTSGNNEIYLYVRKVLAKGKDYYDLSISNIFCESCQQFVKDIKLITKIWKIAKKNQTKTISFLYLSRDSQLDDNLKKRIFLKKSFYTYSLENIEKTDISEFENRNVKKSKRFLQKYQIKTMEDYYILLKMGNKKIKHFDEERQIECQAAFLSSDDVKKNIVSFGIKMNKKLIAGIVAIVVDNNMYMIVNNYIQKYLNYRPNDFLYYLLIEYAKKEKIKQIIWGVVSLEDVGLQRFKEKYSNKKEERWSCHFLSKIPIEKMGC